MCARAPQQDMLRDIVYSSQTPLPPAGHDCHNFVPKIRMWSLKFVIWIKRMGRGLTFKLKVFKDQE